VGLLVLYLIVVIFFPGFEVARQPLMDLNPERDAQPLRAHPNRQDVSFQVAGVEVAAWLYLPDDLNTAVPCIVMNHGFGATKEDALEPYAARFQEAGFAVLAYDYRHFGQSRGEPRQVFSMAKQLEDCRAAIRFVRDLKAIDADRIGIWGTSAGGGYGLILAAEDPRIACICAQCPALDSRADGKVALSREGVGFFLRLFVHGQRDKGRSRFGLSPHTIPIVGEPGTVAILTAPGAIEGYAGLAGSSFINAICARVILTHDGHTNPIDVADKVTCPTLLQICERDNLVAPDTGLKTAEKIGKHAVLKQYPIGHFEIYHGDHFERAVADQITFFKRSMG